MKRARRFGPGEHAMNTTLPRRRNISATILIIMVSILIMPPVAAAQENDGWTFRVTPYLWMLGLDGTTAALGNDVPLEADFGDILDPAPRRAARPHTHRRAR